VHFVGHTDGVDSDATGTIEVFQDRQWAGDPRLGTFTVYVDGVRAGIVRPLDKLTISLAGGVHSIRIRQWWYRSPTVTVDIQEEGQRFRFRADAPKGRAGLRLLFLPLSSLILLQWPD
jgi:hypothetical protein